MRRLMLLRHAKTERAEPGERDRDRTLTKRGRDDATLIGAYMAHHGLVPDIAFASPAKRTRETWALVAAAFAKTPPMRIDDRIYNANVDALLDVIGDAGDARTIVIVGHNPGLHQFAVQWTATGDAKARERLNENLPTSGLVVIDMPIGDWALPAPKSGRLERFVSPRSIAAETE